jgi:hypothetical protein
MKIRLFASCALLALAPIVQAQTATDTNEGLHLVYKTDGTYSLTWWGRSGNSYFVQASDDLLKWSNFPVIETGADSVLQYGLASSGQRLFVRLKYLNQTAADPLSADFDGDGLTNVEEFAHGTDPLDSDTDHDGMPDGWEVDHGLDPLVDDAAGDADNDRLSNLAEYQAGTKPELISTVGDGIPDGWKVLNGLSPLDPNVASADSDGDGIPNSAEFLLNAAPNLYSTPLQGDAAIDWRNQNQIFIDLGAGFFPDGLCNNGTVVLHDAAGSVFRWNGRMTLLKQQGFRGSNSASEWTYTDFIRLNANGWVAIPVANWSHTESGTSSSDVIVNRIDVWGPDATAPHSLYGPTLTSSGIDDAGRNHTESISSIDINLVAVSNSLWGHAWRPDGNVKLSRWDPPGFAEMQYFSSNQYPMQVFGSDKFGHILGSDSTTFVGAPGNYVDYDPIALSPNGTLLGHHYVGCTQLGDIREDTYFVQHGGTYFAIPVITNQQWPAYPYAELTGVDDDANVYGTYYPNLYGIGAEQSVWTLTPSEFGVSGASGTYTRVAYTPIVMPPDWASDHMILPGKARVQLGLANSAIDGRTHAFLMAPASLQVDANRDGVVTRPFEIADTETDATTGDKPFRFWINDDIDRAHGISTVTYEEYEQDDLGGSEAAGLDPDWKSDAIPCERDLEDFARLWINVGGISGSLRTGQIRVGLKWNNVAGGTTPAIKLYPAEELDGGAQYLTDLVTATLQTYEKAAIKDAAQPDTATNPIVEPTTNDCDFVLPTSLFQNLTDAQSTIHLLFEGCKAGTGQLSIVLLTQNSSGGFTKIGDGPGVWMELREPATFVERYTCGDQSLGTVGTLAHYPQTATFAAPTTEDEKDYVLYVHGYNMEDPEKERWVETAYKRLYWLGYKGRVGAFSWPCAYGTWDLDQLRFDDSENRAWRAAVRLKEHLVNLKNLGYRVHVIAHSQGNVVIGEALRLWKAAGQSTPLVSTYIASHAAIAAHCYNAAAPLMPDYEQDTPNVYACYWRAGDSARFPQNWPAANPPYLAASIMQTAAGRWVNFYNPQDFALTAASGGIGSWEQDQRWKPDILSLYSWSLTNGFFKGLVPFETDYSFPDDRYTIFSYCAEARSVALGTNSTGGTFTGGTNLQTIGFADEHLWHSGQFRSFNAARYRYWIALLDAATIPHLNP